MISKRLETILKLIPNGEVLADIGTDHGYIPTYAVKNNIVKKAIAADISKGSLEKAVIEIKNNNLQTKIETRLGSGLEVLEVDEADVVVIAGMGGILISEILNESYHKKYKAKHPILIFQPVQFSEKLRQYLYKNNFDILDEELIEDEGKFYHIIVSRYSLEMVLKTIDPPFDEIGNINYRKANEVLFKLLQSKINTNKAIIDKIKESGIGENNAKVEELSLKIKCYEEMIEDAARTTQGKPR